MVVAPSDSPPGGYGIAFGEAVTVWVRVALQSFGGPAGQIAVMHRILVEEKRWVDEQRFLHALNYCMLLPGPEAQQLATYIGWLLHGVRGGVVAGTLFVLPGFLSILALSLVYASLGSVTVVSGLFFGLKAAVLAIVVRAVFRLGNRVLGNPVLVAVAIVAFVSIAVLAVPFPAIVLGAAVVGAVGGSLAPGRFVVRGAHGAGSTSPGTAELHHAPPRRRRALLAPSVCAVLWFAPILALGGTLGHGNVFFEQAKFFSKAAVVTFGGAYAVLAYIAQAAVESYGWLAPGEMLDGLGMAETTPGPLIQVVQFVGFMGAWRNPGALPPWLAGVLGSLLVTWVTFLPCFLWIFLGAPYVESLRGNRRLSSALAAVTAAVVGVIANLAVWFALHALFRSVRELRFAGGRALIPELESVVWPAVLLSVAALVGALRYDLGVVKLLAACAIGGIVVTTCGLV